MHAGRACFMRFRLAALFALALVALPAGASAKIYIPCTGDRMVKILDVPALKGKGPEGADVALGYKFSGCVGDGEWIGYLDSRQYLTLDEPKLKAILSAAGLTAAPPSPSRIDYPFEALFIEILTAGALICVGIWVIFEPTFNRLRGKT
jgi:hypothetical protein